MHSTTTQPVSTPSTVQGLTTRQFDRLTVLVAEKLQAFGKENLLLYGDLKVLESECRDLDKVRSMLQQLIIMERVNPMAFDQAVTHIDKLYRDTVATANGNLMEMNG
jgi:hypothetical protein